MYSVSVTWYGQSGFRLTAGDSRILMDPFRRRRDLDAGPRPVRHRDPALASARSGPDTDLDPAAR
jgi:L-ascorbate metabolism protein UlaG (beta-lactamase superfamily)